MPYVLVRPLSSAEVALGKDDGVLTVLFQSEADAQTYYDICHPESPMAKSGVRIRPATESEAEDQRRIPYETVAKEFVKKCKGGTIELPDLNP